MTAVETTAAWWRPESAAPAAAAGTAAPETGRTAFAGLLAFTGILIVSPQAWFPVLGSLRIAFVAAAVAIVAELMDRAIRRRPLRKTPPAIVLAFTLVGWAVVTVPLSYWPGGSVATLTEHFLKAIAFFWLIGTVVTTERRLRLLVWLLVFCSIPLSVTAVQNYASGTFLITPDGAMPRIAGYAGGSGLAANPNDLALMINLLIPFAAALLATGRSVAQRLVAGSALLLGIAGVIVTFSRAGFLTLAALGVVGMIAMARRRPLAFMAAIVVLAAGSAMLPQGYFKRLSTITNIESDTTGSAQGRWNDAKVAMGVVARNPVTGVGLNQNILALNQQRGPTWREVHNVYLQYAVDLGIPGLALFLALFITLFRTAGRARQRARGAHRSLATVAGGVQAALIGFAVAAFFHPVAYQFYFFGVAGLALAVQNALYAKTYRPAPQAV